MDKPIIFYGAGKEAESAQFLLEKFDPICFVDKDSSKYSRLFMGKKVIPFKQAMDEYPDSLFYITTSKYKHEIISELLSHDITNERIINYDAVTERFGCKILEHRAGIGYVDGHFRIGFCCGIAGHQNYPGITVYLDMQPGNYERIAQYVKTERNRIISSLGEDAHVCKGCPNLEYGFFTDRKTISLLTNPLPLVCNCKCFYCNNPMRIRPNLPKSELKKIDNFDFAALAESFERYGLMNTKATYGWTAGEISVAKHKESFLDFAKCHTVFILSNALVYDGLIAEWMSDSSSNGYLNVSLDSGTQETFRRIKGVDAYDRVCENVVKYGVNREKGLELKYVFCEGYNDNDRDVDGFFEIAKAANASCVVMERNFFDLEKPLKETTIKAAARFYVSAINNAIQLITGESFTRKQATSIHSTAHMPA